MDYQIITNKTYSYFSYAKINLFLHITGKRDDGYHNLQSWFQFVDLKDTLSFEPIKHNNLLSLKSNITIGILEDNLIYKAALSLLEYASNPQAIEVNLTKRIPMGAGLGGGSSNAATTLIALNEIWQCQLTLDQLMKIGVTLGADVPIFLYQYAAWAEGIGEKLTKKPYKEQYALIIKPPFHANTKEIFSHPLLVKNKPSLSAHDIKDPEHLENVFLPVINILHPEVCHLLSTLPDKTSFKLTGTGACFYLLSTDFDKLLINQKKLEKGVDSWIVKTLNFAPVERCDPA